MVHAAGDDSWVLPNYTVLPLKYMTYDHLIYVCKYIDKKEVTKLAGWKSYVVGIYHENTGKTKKLPIFHFLQARENELLLETCIVWLDFHTLSVYQSTNRN